MSQAEALLNRAALPGAYTSTPETEPHIVIGKDRVITVPDELKRLGVQYDNDIETVVFDCPRYWDDTDMSKLGVYINYERKDGVKGAYPADNITVDDNDDTLMHFEWTISRNVTLIEGNLKFNVCTKGIDEEGFETEHWNSELCESCYISEGLEYGEVLKDMYPDILSQIQKDNVEAIDALKNQLLDAKLNGEFNPVISAQQITGGYRLTVLVGSEPVNIDLMHGSDAVVSEIIDEYFTIGANEPAKGPALWLHSTDGESGTLYSKDKNGTLHRILPVTNINNVEGGAELVAHLGNQNNPHNVTPVQIGAVPNGTYVIGSTNGVSYIGSIPGLPSLAVGMTFTFLPESTSTSTTVSLNVNSLGSFPIRRRVVGVEGGSALGSKASWITANVPVTLTFMGDMWLADMAKADVSDVDGTLAVGHGGTGKTSWDANKLVYASGNNVLGQINAATENNSVLIQNSTGAPKWSSLPSVIENLSVTRFASGTYTGQGGTGNRDLGVTPKILWVQDATSWKMFTNGDKLSNTTQGYSGNTMVEYTQYVQLVNNALVFTVSNPNGVTSPAGYLNNRNTTYKWFAIY